VLEGEDDGAASEFRLADELAFSLQSEAAAELSPGFVGRSAKKIPMEMAWTRSAMTRMRRVGRRASSADLGAEITASRLIGV
jgi:hypothetical protein